MTEDNDRNQNNDRDGEFPNGFGFQFPGGGVFFGGGQGNGQGFDPMQLIRGMFNGEGGLEPGSTVNWTLAHKVALQELKGEAAGQDRGQAVDQAVGLVNLWLDDTTTLARSAEDVKVWDAQEWMDHTMPQWRAALEPVQNAIMTVQESDIPQFGDQVPEFVGQQVVRTMKALAAHAAGNQMGQFLAQIARQTAIGSQWSFPLTGPLGAAPVPAVLPGNVASLASTMKHEVREVLIYCVARELAFHRLLSHAPWIGERLVLALETYASGLTLDESQVDEVRQEMESMQEKLMEGNLDFASMGDQIDFTPRFLSSHDAAAAQYDTLISLIEGWIDVVVGEALFERIPVTAQIHKAWIGRRELGNPLAKNVDMTQLRMDPQHAHEAAELFRRLTVAVGLGGRDKVWDHPDLLPTASDVKNPAAFIDSVLGEGNLSDFDPISEIEALEREINKGFEQDD